MAEYTVVITKMEYNPNYEEEKKEFERVKNYGIQNEPPSKQIEVRKLEVTLSEPEYLKVRDAIFKEWK